MLAEILLGGTKAIALLKSFIKDISIISIMPIQEMMQKIIDFISNQWVIPLTLIVALLTLIVATITLVYIWLKDRREELAVLMSLYQHLEYIKNAAIGQQNQLNITLQQGQIQIPSWTLISVDLNFYLPRINYKIKKQGWLEFGNIYTRDLKDSIIKTADDVNKINNLFNIMYNAIVSPEGGERETILGGHIREILHTPYYTELYGFVDDAHRELEKILKPFKRSSLFWY